MKPKHVFLSLLIVTAGAVSADARPGTFGLGIIVGEPTGIDGKLFLSGTNAFEGAIAWSLRGNNDLHLQGDYLYHRYSVFKPEKGRLPLFFGIGGRVKLRENGDDLLGIRFPVGLAYEFAGAPFDIFIELVPLLELHPDTDFELEGAIGARFYF